MSQWYVAGRLTSHVPTDNGNSIGTVLLLLLRPSPMALHWLVNGPFLLVTFLTMKSALRSVMLARTFTIPTLTSMP